MEVRERLMNLKLSNINCLITSVKPISTNLFFILMLIPILTAQWPVLGRLLSAVYNIQLLDLHCNVT